MKKAIDCFRNMIKGFFLIGFSIQMILGIVWMCFNFSHLKNFGASGGGILFRSLFEMSVRLYPLCYLGQILLACFSGYAFLRVCGFQTVKWRIWGSLVLLTFPVAMQCHLSISPYSAVSSLLLLELCIAVGLIKKRNERVMLSLTQMGLCWLLSSLLIPEYTLIGGIVFIPVLLILLTSFWKNRKKIGSIVLLVCALTGIVVSFRGLDGEGRIFTRENVAFHMFSRATWLTLWNDSAFWPEEVREVAGETIQELTYKAENPERLLRPLMEEHFTEEERIGYYQRMAYYSWIVHGSAIIRQIGWDFLGYSVTMLILPYQLRGVGCDSYSGRNYEMLIAHTPKLAQVYLEYAFWWFRILVVLLSVLLLIWLLDGKRRGRKEAFFILLTCGVTVGNVVLLYTLRGAGMMDYKCSVAVNLLWLLGCLNMMRKDA